MALENPVGRSVYRGFAKTYRSTYKVDFEKITPTPGWNIRTVFDGIDDLANDIANHGIREPLVGDFSEDGKFHIVDGERRYKAVVLLRALGHAFDQLEVRPLDSSMSMLDKLVHMISSGMHKKEYTPLEYSEGVNRLKTEHNLTNEDIGDRLGKSRQWVDMMLILAAASDEDKQKIANGEMTYTRYVSEQRKKRPNVEETEAPPPVFVTPTPDSFDADPVDHVKLDEAGQFASPVVIPMKEPSLVDMNHGIVGPGQSQQYGDRPLDVQDLEKEMQEEEDTETKVKDPVINDLLKRIVKNTNWIESVGKHLPDQSRVDLDTHLQWIRNDVESIKIELKTKLKR